MLNQIKGLHHVTAMASSAPGNNTFWTKTLGLRRVKQTVNFDEPSVYHLYYGDEVGTPGSVMTYFPFPHIARGRPGTGEVGTTVFSVPEGSLGYWEQKLAAEGVADLVRDERFWQCWVDARAALSSSLISIVIQSGKFIAISFGCLG